MAGDELAPWEGGSGRKPVDPAKPASGIQKPYVVPKADKLPDIYKPDDQGFLAHGGATVPRPAPDPRPLDPKGRLALMVLGGAVGLGLLGVAMSFVVLDPESGAFRLIYAGLAGVIALVAALLLIAELPRINAFRMGNFMPGVLVYGSKEQFLKVAGPVGTGTIQGTLAHGSGRGILSAVFDRAAHAASPPEIVALHCDRGAGPELVGIAWDAVRECRRGDIVWFTLLKPNQFLMYHKLIPFAPRVVTDAATREEVFRALKVGQSMFKEAAVSKNMGKTKVFQTDAEGNLVTGRQPAAPKDAAAAEIPLAAMGANFATEEQPEQGAPGEYEAPPTFQQKTPGSDTRGNIKLSQPGKPLGGSKQNQSGDQGGYIGDA